MSSIQKLWQKVKYFFWVIAHEWLFDLSFYVGTVLMWMYSKFAVKHIGRVPNTGGVIVTPNHLSQWDLVVSNYVMPRAYYPMAKAEFFEFFFVGGMVRLLGAFPVNRGKADRQALNRAIELLGQGKALVIFPEGHRSDNYAIGKASNGVAMIARKSNALIVPVAISGTQNISRNKSWQEGKSKWFFLRRPEVMVRVGEPYRLPPPVPGEHEDLDELTDLIMGKIADLLPPEYQGEYSPEKRIERKVAREQAKKERAAKQAARRAAQPTTSPTQEVVS